MRRWHFHESSRRPKMIRVNGGIGEHNLRSVTASNGFHSFSKMLFTTYSCWFSYPKNLCCPLFSKWLPHVCLPFKWWSVTLTTPKLGLPHKLFRSIPLNYTKLPNAFKGKLASLWAIAVITCIFTLLKVSHCYIVVFLSPISVSPRLVWGQCCVLHNLI